MREQSEGPLERQKCMPGAVLDALGVPHTVRRSVGRVAMGLSTGITRETGPGCGSDAAGAVVLALRSRFRTLDAPGLPSRVGLILGMPFVLSTPGGQPVAVCCASFAVTRCFVSSRSPDGLLCIQFYTKNY